MKLSYQITKIFSSVNDTTACSRISGSFLPNRLVLNVESQSKKYCKLCCLVRCTIRKMQLYSVYYDFSDVLCISCKEHTSFQFTQM